MGDNLILLLEALVVIGAILMGTRSSGVGLGLWGGLGTAVLVFVFGEAPGSPPIDAILIVLTVVTASAVMQVAGGIDWMVSVAASTIRKRPKQITYIAPIVSWLFCMGAGTGNIVFPLLPVIYDVSYANRIRPSRPLALSVVVSGVALACTPVSAAMAAMLTLTDVAPYNLGLTEILLITIPSCFVGILVAGFVSNRRGKDFDDDEEIQARIASGELPDPANYAGDSAEFETTKEGRNAALLFLFGVFAILMFGLFPDLRPQITDAAGVSTAVSMATVIEIIMLTVGALIILVSRPSVAEVPTTSVFKSGMVSATALFGLAWLTDTFIKAHEQQIVDTIGGWVQDYAWIFAIAVFLVAALTTSQSTATRTIVPIGLAVGLNPGVMTGMWAAAMAGVFTLPTNGSQIAASNFDQTGSTVLGTKLVDHSFFVPLLSLFVPAMIVGSIIGVLVY